MTDREQDGTPKMLYGSNVLGSFIWTQRGMIPLGDVVRKAFERSKMTVEEWNATPDLERDFTLIKTIYEMRKE